MPLAAGTRLGPYEILGPVGAGGMGQVYRARDTRLGRDVALKVLPADHASDPARVRRFEHEARAVAALNHPNILALYDTGTESGVTYAVFELLEGQTFRGLLQKGPVSPAKVVDHGVQVCRGLAAAHEKGIVHRDLKPENLFLTKDGIVKILDFGLARLVQPREDERTMTLSQGTDPGVAMGTVGYMSPEQVRGEPADHRSDLFALGAVLYEMLSGQRAFRGTSSVETMNAILKEEPEGIEPERKVPPALDRLVRHCLEKSPEDRFQSARDLAFELGSVSALSGIAASVAVRTGARRRRWFAVVLVALALGLTLIGGVLVGRQTAAIRHLTYKQITFRRGITASGRFTPDGRTVVYAASWDDAAMPELYSVRTDAPESKSLGLPPAQVVGVSSKGELAVLVPRSVPMPSTPGGEIVLYPQGLGTLARVPLSGGTPRPVAENVICADWAADGERLAALRRVGGLMQVEFPLGTVVARSSRTKPLGCPRVSRQGRLAFGTPEGYRVIEIASGRSFSITGIPDWGHARYWSWSADGKEIWFTATGSANTFLEFQAVSLSGRRRLIDRIPGHLRLLDVSRDGAALLAAGTSQARAFARAPAEAREREMSILLYTELHDLSADGRRALLGVSARGHMNSYAYLRPTDGSPPMRLSADVPRALSPDGQWALVTRPIWAAIEVSEPGPLHIVPIGAGEARLVAAPGLQLLGAGWVPGGRQVLLVAPDRDTEQPRMFLVDVEGGTPRAVTPGGIGWYTPIPTDGRRVACLDPSGRPTLYPLEPGEPREVPGLERGWAPLRFSSDGGALYVQAPRTRRTAPFRIERVDLVTGRRTLVHEILPPDLAGFWAPGDAVVTPDGRGYGYWYFYYLDDLYLAEGLR